MIDLILTSDTNREERENELNNETLTSSIGFFSSSFALIVSLGVRFECGLAHSSIYFCSIDRTEQTRVVFGFFSFVLSRRSSCM